MPERTLKQLLQDNLAHTDALVAEVKSLKTNVKLLRFLVGLLLAVIVGLLSLGLQNRSIAKDAQGAADRSETALATVEAERQRSSLTTCQLRNSNNENTRRQFTALYDTFERLNIAADPTIVTEISALRANLGMPAQQDRDCDANGALDIGDYAPTASPSTSVPVPPVPSVTTTVPTSRAS